MIFMTATNYEEIAFVPRSTSLDCLKQAAFFCKLTDEEFSAFQSAAQPRTYNKGKVIYVQGEPAEYFYVINSGWIKLFYTLPEGDEVIIDVLTRGSMVGESAIFENGCHTTSAQVVEDVALLSIPTRVLKEQISRSQTLALNMLSSMSSYHRRYCGEMALNEMQSAPQRIGRFLLRFCTDRKHNIVFHLPFEKTLIADLLGMSGATFSRALNILRSKTGLRIKGSRVEIDDVEELFCYVHGSLMEQNLAEAVSA